LRSKALVSCDLVPGDGFAHSVTRRTERSFIGRDEDQRVAEPPLQSTAAHEGIVHRVARRRLDRAFARMRHSWAEDHERKPLGFVENNLVIRRRIDVVKRSLGSGVLSQQLDDGGIYLVLGRCLGTLISQTVERGLRREPVSSGLLV
jgi:hypothetical protein